MADIRPAIIPSLYYKNPLAAIDFIEKAFGFERFMIITNPDGSLAHSELGYNGGVIMVGSVWADFVASPLQTGKKNTQIIHVEVPHDIDGHCQRARLAGAEILKEPEDQFYGARAYQAHDIEGHIWSFAQNIGYVSREEAEKATGFKIEGWV